MTLEIVPGTGLSQEDVEKLIGAESVAGLEFVYGPDNIAAERDRNFEYFRGIMNDLPWSEGRSRVVETTIANYIGLMKPSLLRIFTAGRNIAEYVSPKSSLQSMTKLVTRFINDVVFRKDNRGELMLSDWSEDGLIQKLGVAMYWWEESKEAKDEIHEGLSDMQMLALGASLMLGSGQQIVEHTEEPAESGNIHAVKLRSWKNTSKCCVDVIPPEEFIVSRDARNLRDAVFKAHRTGVFAGDLIRSGYSADDINALPTYTDPYPNTTRKYGRDYTTDLSRAASVDPMLRKVCITRGILKCNYDGTGVKEWFVVSGGEESSPKLLEIQPYNYQIGFAGFCPEPLPHTIYGRCPADRLAGIQKIQTVLIRQANDNVFLANTPQREVVMDWIIKPDQLINMSPGASVLVKQPGAIREIAIPFVADKALLMMQYYDGQAEITSGASRNSAGLDPEVLQNQSATANANMMSAQQGRIEMIARTWAQGGMRDLFRGIFQCIRAYQDFARVVLIDGEPQTVDPRTWDELDDLDVNINTGLGTGNRDRDYAVLQSIGQTQAMMLEKLGPNPIVDFQKISRTLQDQAEAAGMNYPENYYGDAKNPDGSPWKGPEPVPPQPSPDVIANAQALVAMEQIKAQSHERINQATLAAKSEDTAAQIASNERLGYYKAQLDAMIKAEQLGIDTARVMVDAAAVDVNAHKIRADIKGDQAA